MKKLFCFNFYHPIDFAAGYWYIVMSCAEMDLLKPRQNPIKKIIHSKCVREVLMCFIFDFFVEEEYVLVKKEFVKLSMFSGISVTKF